MKKRNAKDIWQGLYDFYLMEKARPTKTENLFAEIADVFKHNVTIEDMEISGTYKHILSHQVILSKFVLNQSRKVPSAEG